MLKETHAQVQPAAAGDRRAGGDQIDAGGGVGLQLLGLNARGLKHHPAIAAVPQARHQLPELLGACLLYTSDAADE